MNREEASSTNEIVWIVHDERSNRRAEWENGRVGSSVDEELTGSLVESLWMRPVKSAVMKQHACQVDRVNTEQHVEWLADYNSEFLRFIEHAQL